MIGKYRHSFNIEMKAGEKSGELNLNQWNKAIPCNWNCLTKSIFVFQKHHYTQPRKRHASANLRMPTM